MPSARLLWALVCDILLLFRGAVAQGTERGFPKPNSPIYWISLPNPCGALLTGVKIFTNLGVRSGGQSCGFGDERFSLSCTTCYGLRTRFSRGGVAQQNSGQISGQSARIDDGLSSSIRSTARRFQVIISSQNAWMALLGRLERRLLCSRPPSLAGLRQPAYPELTLGNSLLSLG
jgi:hypothetical protein